MKPEEDERTSVAFASGGLTGDRLAVWRLSGTERLSALFRYDVDLFTAGPLLTEREQQALVASPCAVRLGPGALVRGVIDRLVAMEPPAALSEVASARYRVRIVPTVSLLTRAEHTRTFERMSVHDVVDEILSSYGLLRGADYDLLVAPRPAERWVRQVRESDWSFIQRWLEHEGSYYWFDHTGESERLVVAESNADAAYVTEPRLFWYDALGEGGESGATGDPARGAPAERVWGVRVTTRRTAARVAIMSEEGVAPVVLARQDVDHATGFGTLFDHSEHGGDLSRAAELAKMRAEALRARGRVVGGYARSPLIRAGHRFELAYHPAQNLDGAYLVTRSRVAFAGGQLTVTFEAIPFDVPFRPLRRTPWPPAANEASGRAPAASPPAAPEATGVRVELVPLFPEDR